MSDQQDFAWIEAFLAQDESGFDHLVLRYKDKVFNLCYRFLGDRQEANDCAQETFVKVYRSLKNFRFDASFSTWLYTITVNTCKNRLKSAEYRYRNRKVPIDPKEEGEQGHHAELEDPAPSPLAHLESREKETLIQRALDALPQEPKTMIVLRDIEGLSYEEIAHVTGYQLGTVKSKLCRARQQLREKLKGVI